MDELVYRVPGYDPVFMKGSFVEIDDTSKTTGFLVSDFSGTHLFTFIENELPNKQHQSFSFQITSKEDYLAQVEYLVSQIKSGVIKKAVLSRIVACDFSLYASDLFSQACHDYPNAFVYHFRSELLGEWFGASPELLLRGSEKKMETMALAGTKTSVKTDTWGDKERMEQDFVTSYILDVLKKQDVKDVVVEPVEEVQAGPVKHLRTKIRFQSDSDAIKLIRALHPTPAVCGTPLDEAKKVILDVEQHKRELYTGFIGLLGEKTELFVNLRCMQLTEDKAYLYVGGGITEESNPESEWEETANKALTLLRLMEKM